MTQTMTVAEFVEKHGITMAHTRISERPDGWEDDSGAFHFACTLRRDKFAYATDYSMGSGHGKKVDMAFRGPKIMPPTPKVEDVLDCLRSDAQSADNAGGFEDWASDLGYDTDSRKAHATWEACKEVSRKLRHFLGSAAYDELMSCEPM